MTGEGMRKEQAFSSSYWSSEPSQGREISWCHLHAHRSINSVLFLLAPVLGFVQFSFCPVALLVLLPVGSLLPVPSPLLGPEQTHPPFIPRLHPSFYPSDLPFSRVHTICSLLVLEGFSLPPVRFLLEFSLLSVPLRPGDFFLTWGSK